MKSLLGQFDVSEDRIRQIVTDAIAGADDGELFLEYSESEALMFDNGRLKTGNFNTEQGFGLRAVAGEATGFAHASELSHAALMRASDAVSAVKGGYSGTLEKGWNWYAPNETALGRWLVDAGFDAQSVRVHRRDNGRLLACGRKKESRALRETAGFSRPGSWLEGIV